MREYTCQIYLYLLAIILVLAGGLNWGLIGTFDYNLVKEILGKYAYVVYIMVGIATVYLLFQRDTYLPFLGINVLPPSALRNSTPDVVDRMITIDVDQPAEKLIYWAAEKDRGMIIPTPYQAYGDFENSGVVDVIDNKAVLEFQEPSKYEVHGKVQPIHIHYRTINKGMMSPIKTLFLESQ